MGTQAAHARRLERLVPLLMAGIIVYQTLVPPIIGLANNGDFDRILGRVGLDYVSSEYDDRYFAYVNTKYVIVPRDRWNIGYVTSELIPVEIALLINRLVSKDGLFDVRILGLVHAAGFLLATWVVMLGSRGFRAHARYVLAALLVLIFTDVGYVAYFNTIYTEPASLIFLCFTVGVILFFVTRENARPWQLIVYFAAAALFVLAKPQNSVLGLFLAPFGIRLAQARFSGQWRRLAVGLSVVLTLLSIAYYLRTPQFISEQNVYNQVFFEILRTSQTPEEDLAALGLQSDLVKYAGGTYYAPDAPVRKEAFRDAFFSRVGYVSILRFYASHPDRFWGLMKRGARSALLTRPEHHGNFVRSDAPTPRAQSQAFALWSGLKERFGPKSIWFLLAFIVTNVSMAVVTFRLSKSKSERLLCELLVLFCVMAGVQFVTALVGAGGELDLIKHLFLFNIALDACIIIDIVWVARRMQAMAPRRMVPIAVREVVEARRLIIANDRAGALEQTAGHDTGD